MEATEISTMLGKTIRNRYHIIQFVGRGAFGETWLAEDQDIPDRPKCVVKKLSPQSSDPEVLEMARLLFNREAETLQQLGQHDQIPRLLAHCEENQQFYLVQEFIPGHDLKQELPPGSKLTEDPG